MSLAATYVGWLASLGVGMLSLTVPWLLLSAVDAPAERSVLARTRAFLFDAPDETAALARSGVLLAALACALFASATSFVFTREVVIDMAQPHFAAITIVALNAALLLAATLLFARLLPAAQRFARFLATTSLGAPLRTPARLVGSMLGVSAALLVALSALFWGTLQYLPWGVIACLLLGALLTVASEFGLSRARRGLRRAASVIVLISFAAGVVAMFALDPEDGRDRRALRESLLGGAGRNLALALFDLDDDGYLSFLGDGDCAPFDPQVHPGAIDYADNGRDEDCDGVDLSRSLVTRRPRQNWPVTSAVPNRLPVILITIDTFAARHMHALGGARDITPKLDAFAKQGTLFTHCFAQGPSTRLSFPSIFTSRWDTQIKRTLVGKHPYPLEPSEMFLAEALRNHGYDTTAIVPGEVFSTRRWSSLLQGFAHVVDATEREGRGKDHRGALITDAAISALKRDTHGKPIFLWAHYYDAHAPHRQPKDAPKYGTAMPDIYDAELSLVDRDVGRLLAEVEQTFHGTALVIVTADHGVAFDAPRHSKHHYGYDLATNVLHVPLIIRGPGVRAQVLDEPVSTMDIAPTVTNLLRVSGRFPFEGASLVPELLSGERTRPERLHHQLYLLERRWKGDEPLAVSSLRTDRYNLIHDHRSDLYELYDYEADYEEQHDLSEAKEHAAAFRALKRQLQLFVYEVSPPPEDAEKTTPESGKKPP